MVCTLNGQCSGASFREERLTLAERGKIDVFKINGDDDDDENEKELYNRFNNIDSRGPFSLGYKFNRYL